MFRALSGYIIYFDLDKNFNTWIFLGEYTGWDIVNRCYHLYTCVATSVIKRNVEILWFQTGTRKTGISTNFRELYVRAVSTIGGIQVGFSWKFNNGRVESSWGILIRLHIRLHIYYTSRHAGALAYVYASYVICP